MRGRGSHILIICVLIAVSVLGVGEGVRNFLSELRFSASTRTASREVVLVAIDAPSLQAIGKWPWPRSIYADIIKKLTAAGVAEIAFDVDFSAHQSPENDKAFADALKEAEGSVILPAFQQISKNSSGKVTVHETRPLPKFAENAWLAHVNVAPDPDGVIRHYTFGEVINGEFIPSLGALTAGAFDPNKQPFYIDFGIDPATIPVVSSIDVLNGTVTGIDLRGKKVIIGGTAIELGDRFLVPYHGIIAGPAIQALAAETILQGRSLHKTSAAVTLFGIFIILLLMVALWNRVQIRTQLIVLFSLAVSIELAATVVQNYTPLIIDTALWHITIAAYLFAVWLTETNLRGFLARIAQRRFRSIAHALGDGIICLDSEGNITFYNAGAQTILGYSCADACGKPISKICALKDENGSPFSLLHLPADLVMAPGGHRLELTATHKDGSEFPIDIGISAWEDEGGIHYGIILRDITERKRHEKHVLYLAEHDTLTGLANRNRINQEAVFRIEAARAEQSKLAIVLMDLDHFKEVNDAVGHQNGDQMLCKFARCLEELVSEGDLLARLGGDEFLVLMDGPDAAQRANGFANEVQEKINGKPVILDGHQFYMSATMGTAIFPKDGNDANELLANADLALYHAKSLGRGCHWAFAAELRDSLEKRQQLEEELRRALKNNEFELFYQPQIRLADCTLVGAEALIRWRHPERGILSPFEFLTVIEEGPLAEDVGKWVFAEACRQAQEWRQNLKTFRIGINLSTSQFRSDLCAFTEKMLADTGLPAECLELEITENLLLDTGATIVPVLRKLRDKGVGIALDDFGTGFASLTHLKEFPLSRLKIDKSFVQELDNDGDNAAIVSAVVWLGRNLGLEIIAEGIEEWHHVEHLQRIGTDEGQGYFFSRPLPADEFAQRYFGANSKEKFEEVSEAHPKTSAELPEDGVAA